METLNIAVLKKIIEHIPEDYTVEYDNRTTVSPLDNSFEVDINGKRLILKV